MPFFNRSFVVAVLVVLIAFACYFPFSPMWQQRVGMRHASELCTLIRNRIENDPTLKPAKLLVSTQPSVLIHAEFSRQEDVDRLVNIVREEYAHVQHVPRVSFGIKLNEKVQEIDPLPEK